MTSQILKLTLSFSLSRFSTWKKSQDKKFRYLENEKSLQAEIKSIFFILLKVFPLPKIVSDLRVYLLMISLVNVKKSAVSCIFAHIHKRNPEQKTLYAVLFLLKRNFSDKLLNGLT